MEGEQLSQNLRHQQSTSGGLLNPKPNFVAQPIWRNRLVLHGVGSLVNLVKLLLTPLEFHAWQW